MKFIVSLLFSLLAITTVYSQNPTNSGNLSDGFKIMRSDSKGTPFLTEAWNVGYGILEDGKITRPQQLNYDIHGNNLVYKVGSSDQVMKLLDNSFTGFILKDEDGDLLFAKIDGNDFDKSKDHAKYYQIVNAPSRAVIVEYVKELKDPNSSGWTSSMNNTLSSEYILKTNYYVLNKNSKYDKVKLNNRGALKVFKDKKNKVSNFMKSQNIKIETPMDLFQVAEYYHSL